MRMEIAIYISGVSGATPCLKKLTKTKWADETKLMIQSHDTYADETN